MYIFAINKLCRHTAQLNINLKANNMKNKDFTCFNEWKKELIYYKSKVHWIDKNGKNHYLWTKYPRFDKDGNIDDLQMNLENKENQINTYRHICDKYPELLTKKKKSLFSLIFRF